MGLVSVLYEYQVVAQHNVRRGWRRGCDDGEDSEEQQGQRREFLQQLVPKSDESSVYYLL